MHGARLHTRHTGQCKWDRIQWIVFQETQVEHLITKAWQKQTLVYFYSSAVNHQRSASSQTHHAIWDVSLCHATHLHASDYSILSHHHAGSHCLNICFLSFRERRKCQRQRKPDSSKDRELLLPPYLFSKQDVVRVHTHDQQRHPIWQLPRWSDMSLALWT